MKYERIIIASIVCMTAIVCCKIIVGNSRWQFSNRWIFDSKDGVAYMPEERGKCVVFVRTWRSDETDIENLPEIK